MYLKRKIDDKLQSWKNSSGHLPLIISGARQIGKSSSIMEFAKRNYENIVEINFILEPQYKAILQDGYSVDSILRNITLINPAVRLTEGNTLIFFDEIQECPDIETSLKSFSIDGRFDVICSGSLLGVQYKLVSSISAGYSQRMKMHAMDFEEFLWAIGYGTDSVDSILSHMIDAIPFSELEFNKFSALFFDFCITGGLPRIVETYANNRNFSGISDLQSSLITDYVADITKYHGELDAARIRSVFSHIPVFLSKENKKFMASAIKKKGTIDEFVPSIQWLIDAGLVLPCYNLQLPECPLSGNYDERCFKLYFFDTGLFLSMLEPESQLDFRTNRNFGVYKGGLYENIIAESLDKQGKKLFYYKKDNSMLEEDFFLRMGEYIVPVEVKATNNRSKALRTLIQSSVYKDIRFGIKLIGGNVGFADNIYTFPHFTAFVLDRFLNEMH